MAGADGRAVGDIHAPLGASILGLTVLGIIMTVRTVIQVWVDRPRVGGGRLSTAFQLLVTCKRTVHQDTHVRFILQVPTNAG